MPAEDEATAPEQMEVTLTWNEVSVAVHEGGLRRIRRLSKLARGDIFKPGDKWGVDIESTAAEIAFAKAMGLYWGPSSGSQNVHKGDVEGWEIKSSARLDNGLKVRPMTPGHKMCVLVVGEIPTFRVIGRLLASDAQVDRYWNAYPEDRDGGAWIVPQRDLLPIARGDTL